MPPNSNNTAKAPYDYLFKILLIGDSGVGKTCLLFRFSEDAFNTTFIATIGIDFKIKTIEIDGKRIKLQIWDTAGHERFRTITTAYYRGAMGILLVYDITNEKSFENIKTWIRNIDEHTTTGVEKIILGNKCDVPIEKRIITRDRGEQLAIEQGVKFMETSAKSGINVEEAFIAIAKNIKTKTDKKIEASKMSSSQSSNSVKKAKSNSGFKLFDYRELSKSAISSTSSTIRSLKDSSSFKKTSSNQATLSMGGGSSSPSFWRCQLL